MKLRYHSDSSSFYDNDDEDLESALLCFNLANLIERLEWRIDLKLLHLEG